MMNWDDFQDLKQRLYAHSKTCTYCNNRTPQGRPWRCGCPQCSEYKTGCHHFIWELECARRDYQRWCEHEQ